MSRPRDLTGVYDFADEKVRAILGPCRVFDATDRQVRFVRRCTITTGEVERYIYPYEIGADGRVRTVLETHPAPLMFEMIGPDDPYLKPPSEGAT